MLASDDLVQKITNQCASDNGVNNEIYTGLEPFNMFSYTQKKVPENVDAEKFSTHLIASEFQNNVK